LNCIECGTWLPWAYAIQAAQAAMANAKAPPPLTQHFSRRLRLRRKLHHKSQQRFRLGSQTIERIHSRQEAQKPLLERLDRVLERQQWLEEDNVLMPTCAKSERSATKSAAFPGDCSEDKPDEKNKI
jgi:hypothetical protein